MSRDCAPCIKLGRELAAVDRGAISLVVVGDIDIGDIVLAGRITDPVEVDTLQRAMLVHESPYLWVVRTGEVVAGGVVNTPADVMALASASSSG